uniref:antitoxin n=1 Tax=Castellaniella defragrans TaxID=75697 RepID=UPI00334283E8
MSRLTIDITPEQHKSLKALASLQGKTIKEYTLEKLFPGDPGGEQAWQDLKTLLRQRIEDGLAGKVSAKTLGDILDEELAQGKHP